jgi:hypothetical protein
MIAGPPSFTVTLSEKNMSGAHASMAPTSAIPSHNTR